MLRVHFLNVGHGDCTIISHPSGRLTVIDINNSQDYDEDSFKDFSKEQAKKKNLAALPGLLPRQSALASLLGSSPPLPAVLPRSLTPWNELAGLIESMSPLPAVLPASSPPSPPQNSLAMFAERLQAARQAKKELTDPIEFLKTNYPSKRVWRFILTHPDLDHMRGIKNLHDKIGFDNFWDTDHTKPAPTFRSDDDKVDWEFYQKLRAGNVGPSHRFYTRGDSVFAFAKDENGLPGGDNIEILSPTPDLVRACNQAGKSNSLSLVLRVSHVDKSVLLPGDAEDDAWDIMTAFYGKTLKSDFLKASHHGRDTGYNLNAVQLISPILTFVSVGRKPDTDATSKYRQQCQRIASTRYYGNIEVWIHDNGQIELFAERNWG